MSTNATTRGRFVSNVLAKTSLFVANNVTLTVSGSLILLINAFLLSEVFPNSFLKEGLSNVTFFAAAETKLNSFSSLLSVFSSALSASSFIF